ncbi:MAG: peptide chain release factor N(5)-glutamine methyltransferase [Fibrobacterota bacterium]
MNPEETDSRKFLFDLIAGISEFSPTSRQDGEAIAEHLLSCSAGDIYMGRAPNISRAHRQKAAAILARFRSGEPLAYILGSGFFFDRNYTLSRATLIPRQDTETLVYACLEAEAAADMQVLELGTGAGIIPQSLSAKRPSWHFTSTDISTKALITARENTGPAVHLVNCSRFDALKKGPFFDIIISNPPYIPSKTCTELDRSVREHEPLSALDGGRDGLDFYRYLADEGSAYLRPGGRIYLEIGWDQGATVPALLTSQGWKDVRCLQDLGGRNRVVRAICRRNTPSNAHPQQT